MCNLISINCQIKTTSEMNFLSFFFKIQGGFETLNGYFKALNSSKIYWDQCIEGILIEQWNKLFEFNCLSNWNVPRSDFWTQNVSSKF